MTSTWRHRAGTHHECEKQPAEGASGMVVANHPLGAAAGAEMLAAGGNAIDAAVAALFTLSVVEPMMVGILGGGMAHIRTPEGRHVVIDGLSAAPAASRPDLFRPVADTPDRRLETEGRENAVGVRAMATPGALNGWLAAHAQFGRLPRADILAPAIRHAASGFAVTPYLRDCIGECAEDLARDPLLSALLLPDGAPPEAGARLVQGEYGDTLREIAATGAAALYDGPLGAALCAHMAKHDGQIATADLQACEPIWRDAVHGRYRGHDIVGPPPPSSGGIHVIQMLNILEGFDLAALGFGTPEGAHLILEALKIAFADRAAATADPAHVDVPVARLIDPAYAAERRAEIDPDRARAWSAAVAAAESANTTHVTAADAEGWWIASTQTINSLFGARFAIPGTGMIANNYMSLFDPHPGRALSIAPGKRVTTSQAPVMACRDGDVRFALGLPGGLRIFGSAMQALVNLLEHGMSLQEAVEAPRLWSQGESVEVESGFGAPLRQALAARGHAVVESPHVGGGMNAIERTEDGRFRGAACWRADGTAIGLGGGLARGGVRFWPDRPR